MARVFSYIAVLLWFALGCNNPATREVQESFPNIVYILADDLGYGDVSCYVKEPIFVTPHIDSMAMRGMRFTDAHSNSVCTPTRYTILTGRYSWRTRLKQGVTWSYDLPLIEEDRTTVADILGDKGYHTASIGKWHLGLGWQEGADSVDITAPLSPSPLDLGFDYFFGITASLDIPPYIYIENDRTTSMDIDSIEGRSGKEFWREGPIGHDFKHVDVLPVLTKKAVDYIDQRSDEVEPFFLYLPLPAPHTPILPTEEFAGRSGTNEYGDFVLMVDDVVGQIVSALRRTGIVENTLLIFTSDNGCSPMANFEELASFGHLPGGPFRGGKADIYEAGHRVPFVVQWPERIAANSTSDQLTGLVDLMATAAEMVGDTLDADEGEDSYSMLSSLLGKSTTMLKRPDIIHHSINGSFAIRKDSWKLAFCPGSGGWSSPTPKEAAESQLPPLQLFDLSIDPGEQNNLIDQHSDRVEELTAIIKRQIEEGRSTPGVRQANDTETTLFPH